MIFRLELVEHIDPSVFYQGLVANDHASGSSGSDRDDLSRIILEKEDRKRKIINSLIQGCFFLASVEYGDFAEEIPDEVKEAYRQIMRESLESNYRAYENGIKVISPKLSSQEVSGLKPGSLNEPSVMLAREDEKKMGSRDWEFNPLIKIAGVVKVDWRHDPLVIEARAICGSVLLLESVKGFLELTALRGLPGAQLDPNDMPEVVGNYYKEMQHYVLREADKLELEVPGLLYGIDLWPRVIKGETWSERLESFLGLCLQPADFFDRYEVNF